MIPDATEADYERDAEADFATATEENNWLGTSWIRRAVAAEKECDRLRDENEKLRKFARNIATNYDHEGRDECYHSCRVCAAEEALNPPTQTDAPEHTAGA
jgi:hypothetical protein